jgi:hypothetical protein
MNILSRKEFLRGLGLVTLGVAATSCTARFAEASLNTVPGMEKVVDRNDIDGKIVCFAHKGDDGVWHGQFFDPPAYANGGEGPGLNNPSDFLPLDDKPEINEGACFPGSIKQDGFFD